jgi:hypothetical protein
MFAMLRSASVVPTEISKDHALHAFHVAQLVMEMHHALWLESEHTLQAEQANSAKLKASLQVRMIGGGAEQREKRGGEEWKSKEGSRLARDPARNKIHHALWLDSAYNPILQNLRPQKVDERLVL